LIAETSAACFAFQTEATCSLFAVLPVRGLNHSKAENGVDPSFPVYLFIASKSWYPLKETKFSPSTACPCRVLRRGLQCSASPSRLSLAAFAHISVYALLARAAETVRPHHGAVLSAHGTEWRRKEAAANTVRDFSQLR